jgi:small-conductance mechanosensitive channel
MRSMLAPLNLELIQKELSTRDGWIELGAILLAFAVGWWADRRIRLGSERESRVARFGAGSVNRLIFPLTTLTLLLLFQATVRHWHAPALFPIAIPLVIALALIRIFIYALRNLFGAHAAVLASERAVSFTIWGALLLYYVGVLPEIGAAMEETQLPIGKARVSLLDLGRDALVVIVALILSLWISSLMEQRLMRASHFDSNLRVVLAKLLRAILILVAVLVSLSFVGIDLTVLSVFGGAVGVGIGLGLPKLASNYIAGFTILLDRSIRVGDMITVDNRLGVVSKVTSRYVVLRSLDGVEAIVPNETLVTTTVLNHSYTSKDIKVGVTLQIAYGTDLDLAMRLMTEVALAQKRVLRTTGMAPVVNVLRFADSGIELELAVWINDPENGQGNLKSDLNIGMWKAFVQQGIEIPYPTREIRIIDAPQRDTAAKGAQPPA